MDEQIVQRFWQQHACGDAQVGGLRGRFGDDYERFFSDYDRFRYQNERHLPACIDALDVAGKQVLEIGLGEGSESERLIRRGARWSGVDLTAESVARVRARLALRELPYEQLRQASVLDLPFADDSFDLVFSHGVLHHVPDIKQAQREIYRVLRPAGELVIMMYARWSLNYLVSIAVIRRAALLGAYPLARAGLLKPGDEQGMLATHLGNARAMGLPRYLRLDEFVHHNTDGPANPYALVYDRRRIQQAFPCFRITHSYKRFMHSPPFPTHRLPGQSVLGWHLWAHLVPVAGGGQSRSSGATGRLRAPMLRQASRPHRMRVAINLLTEDPAHPSGAHWFWTRMVPEMARRLEAYEELHLLVSPKSRHLYQDYGPRVRYITYPWSNERRALRTLSEHLYSPPRLRLSNIDVFNTLMAPLMSGSWSLVIHMKTMHAFTAPDSLTPLARAYRRMNYPRSARVADAIIINSESLRGEIQKYLHADARKLKLIYEAVDHDLFKPGDAGAARARITAHGVTKPFVLFVSSLWPYKNCDGLLRAWALARAELKGRQLAIVGAGRDEKYVGALHALAAELGIAADVVFVGGVPLEETVCFYQAADAFVYPSFNETFGLPILEAMACGCPVVTSDTSAMPETAGGAAILSDPKDPASIARAVAAAVRPGGDRLREAGLRRASQFTWGATAASTLDVYREVAERRRRRS
jgi:glycosyltransferase involved in cell wall biosynthesis/SAM-dependent methyltransferase